MWSYDASSAGGFGILWKLFGEDLVRFAAISKPSETVESLRLTEKSFLKKFWVCGVYVEIAKCCFELVGSKGGEGTVEFDRSGFLCGRGCFKGPRVAGLVSMVESIEGQTY
jgi:hypothetical protein